MGEPIEEKDAYVNDSPSPTTSHHFVDANGQESKDGRIAEAADVYGNIATAEEYGYVKRGYAALMNGLMMWTRLTRDI